MSDSNAVTPTTQTDAGTQVLSKPQPPRPLPPWKVLLHNDDHNTFPHVIKSLVQLCNLSEQEAILRAVEAHKTGLALVLTTHKEKAELHQEQLTSVGLIATIEPSE